MGTILCYVGVGLFVVIMAGFARLKLGGPPGLQMMEIPSLEDPTGINRTKVYVNPKGFQFVPFLPKGDGVPLEKAGLQSDEELLMVERDGECHLYVAREMAYHHVAQNTMAGEPYMISF